MGRLPKDLELKRQRLMGAARRGAFDSYVRHGRVPDVYYRIAEVVSEAKALNADFSVISPAPAARPVGRPTTHYVWRTAGDNRVRGAHAARDGQIFAWNDPPKHGHPGHEPNCRCWPEPYYGDPAVPDSMLALVPGRRVNTDPGVLWASIDTLTRPDGSLAASSVVMNDGAVIDSTFAGASIDHQVRLPDSALLKVERGGDALKLSVHPSGGERVRVAQVGRLLFPPVAPPPASLPSAVDRVPATSPSLQVQPWLAPFNAARLLFNMLQHEPATLGAGSTDVPVLVYRVWQSNAGAAPVLMTETLTQEQVTQWCPSAAEVQSFIDLAAEQWAPLVPKMDPRVVGTNIHMSAKRLLDAAKLANPEAYANMYPEVSLDLAPKEGADPDRFDVTYGASGSTRLDVLELVSPQMGCVYDYKTGSSGLTTKRIMQIIAVWNHRFPDVPVVIIEMRQNLPVWSQ
jgi:hypothetical protein